MFFLKMCRAKKGLQEKRQGDVELFPLPTLFQIMYQHSHLYVHIGVGASMLWQVKILLTERTLTRGKNASILNLVF